MKIGYARVSTALQHEDAQITRLTDAGCERIYADHGVSGTKASRPEWDRLTDPASGPLRAGDIVVAVKLDRFGRSVKHLIAVAEDFRARGIEMVVLDQAIDTTTPAGKLVFHILGAVAEFERDLISERTRDALAVRTARGRNGGRRRALSPEQETEIRKLYARTGENGTREYSGTELARLFGVSRSVIYETLNPARRENQRQNRRARWARTRRDAAGRDGQAAS